MRITGTARLTMAAMFVTLAMVLQQLPSPPGGLLKFQGFPIILSGLLLGPGTGALVGGLSDVLTYVLHPMGPYIPIFTLTSALTGALPALLLGRSEEPGFMRLWLTLWGSQLAIKLGLVAPTIHYIFGPRLGHLMSLFALEQTLHAPLYAWLSLSVWRAYRRQQQME